MKFFRSIRWQIQIWHGLLLGAVLAGFGYTSFRLHRDNLFRRIEQELDQRIPPIADTMRHGGGGVPPDHQPGMHPTQPPGMSPDEPPGPHPDHPPDFHLRERDEHLFDDGYYFETWLHDGAVASKSPSAPDFVPRPDDMGRHRGQRVRGPIFESYQFTPHGECVLVGRDIGPEFSALHRYAGLLFGAGSVVFVLGLAGGWWISAKALRPIQDISNTAGNIAAGDLSQRIPEQDTGTELGGLVTVLNDTFARLQASFARQAQFTADASHELRTPVSVVLTQTQTSLARERPAAEYRESLEACRRAALRMRRLTESLLTLARLDASQGETPRTTCDLASIAAESVDLLRPLAIERGVELQIETALVFCSGDAEQLCQVVTNLVSNAIHYNKPAGSVVVNLSAREGEATLTVRDTGQGIAAEDIPHIFERFYRADKSRTGSSGHLGLGLSITKGIVKAHGGSIRVESEIGNGSTFTVNLPLSSEK